MPDDVTGIESGKLFLPAGCYWGPTNKDKKTIKIHWNPYRDPSVQNNTAYGNRGGVCIATGSITFYI